MTPQGKTNRKNTAKKPPATEAEGAGEGGKEEGRTAGATAEEGRNNSQAAVAPSPSVVRRRALPFVPLCLTERPLHSVSLPLRQTQQSHG
jgi:hypothetical protein